MALQQDVTLRGLSVGGAYIRVTGVKTSRPANRAVVQYAFYPSAEAVDTQIDAGAAVFPYNPDATVAWAYNQLKTLPEFAGAIDV